MIKLSLDTVCWNRKPKDGEIGVISKSVPKHIVEMEIEEFATNVVQPYGKTWCSAIFRDGLRSNETFEEQQIFGLDIDEGISFEEMIERCNKYNIIPAFVYTTFSSKNNNKFRVIFVLEHKVKDKRVRDLIQLALMKLFPESDKACKDASRLFFGGLELLYSNYDKTINVPELIDSMIAYLYATDKTHSARDVKDFCKYTGVNMINGLPNIKIIDKDDNIMDNNNNNNNNNCEIVGEMTINPNIIVGVSDNSPTIYSIDFSQEIVKEQKKATTKPTKIKYNISNTIETRESVINHFNWEDLEDNCKLYKEFADGTHWAYHLELFGIATNLLAIDGGRKRLFEALSKDEKYDINNWEYQCNYIIKKNYTPQRCTNFCPHKSTCEHGLNMIWTAKVPRGRISVLSTPILKTLEQAELDLSDAFETIQATGKVGEIYCLKAVTGLGKTQMYLNIKNTTIAVPNHALKNEIYNRCLEAGNDVVMTPSLPELPEEQSARISKLYKIGAYRAATKYIHDLALVNPKVKEYIVQNESALKSYKTLITTHSKLLYLQETNNDTVIIDEDILSNLINVDYVYTADLMQLEREAFSEKTQNIIDDLLMSVKKAKCNIIQEMPSYLIKNKEVYSVILSHTNSFNTNVLGFLDCTHYIKSYNSKKQEIISFVNRRVLPINKKIILMSATLNEEICKLVFGDRMIWVDLGEVELKGNIVQYPQKSFSRFQIKENKDLIPLAQNIVGELPTITYKSLANKFNTIATFGATAGLDSMKGQDIAVIGTPHVSEIVYLLFANALGLKPKLNDATMHYTKIKRNGYEFWFNTYSNDLLLREIQIYIIESELIQSIGRARLLRNDCTVVVLSNLPMQQAEFVYLTNEEIALLKKGKVIE